MTSEIILSGNTTENTFISNNHIVFAKDHVEIPKIGLIQHIKYLENTVQYISSTLAANFNNDIKLVNNIFIANNHHAQPIIKFKLPNKKLDKAIAIQITKASETSSSKIFLVTSFGSVQLAKIKSKDFNLDKLITLLDKFGFKQNKSDNSTYLFATNDYTGAPLLIPATIKDVNTNDMDDKLSQELNQMFNSLVEALNEDHPAKIADSWSLPISLVNPSPDSNQTNFAYSLITSMTTSAIIGTVSNFIFGRIPGAVIGGVGGAIAGAGLATIMNNSTNITLISAISGAVGAAGILEPNDGPNDGPDGDDEPALIEGEYVHIVEENVPIAEEEQAPIEEEVNNNNGAGGNGGNGNGGNGGNGNGNGGADGGGNGGADGGGNGGADGNNENGNNGGNGNNVLRRSGRHSNSPKKLDPSDPTTFKDITINEPNIINHPYSYYDDHYNTLKTLFISAAVTVTSIAIYHYKVVLGTMGVSPATIDIIERNVATPAKELLNRVPTPFKKSVAFNPEIPVIQKNNVINALSISDTSIEHSPIHNNQSPSFVDRMITQGSPYSPTERIIQDSSTAQTHYVPPRIIRYEASNSIGSMHRTSSSTSGVLRSGLKNTDSSTFHPTSSSNLIPNHSSSSSSTSRIVRSELENTNHPTFYQASNIIPNHSSSSSFIQNEDEMVVEEAYPNSRRTPKAKSGKAKSTNGRQDRIDSVAPYTPSSTKSNNLAVPKSAKKVVYMDTVVEALEPSLDAMNVDIADFIHKFEAENYKNTEILHQLYAEITEIFPDGTAPHALGALLHDIHRDDKTLNIAGEFKKIHSTYTNKLTIGEKSFVTIKRKLGLDQASDEEIKEIIKAKSTGEAYMRYLVKVMILGIAATKFANEMVVEASEININALPSDYVIDHEEYLEFYNYNNSSNGNYSYVDSFSATSEESIEAVVEKPTWFSWASGYVTYASAKVNELTTYAPQLENMYYCYKISSGVASVTAPAGPIAQMIASYGSNVLCHYVAAEKAPTLDEVAKDVTYITKASSCYAVADGVSQLSSIKPGDFIIHTAIRSTCNHVVDLIDHAYFSEDTNVNMIGATTEA